MRIIYYKVFQVWQPYPMNDCLKESYCLFSFKKKFNPIPDLKIDSDTTIKEKQIYLKQKIGLKYSIINIIKL